MLSVTDVNLGGILVDADVDPEGLVGGEEWGPLEEESGEGLGPLPLPRKMNFRLK